MFARSFAQKQKKKQIMYEQKAVDEETHTVRDSGYKEADMMSEKWTVHRCIMCTVYRSRSPISSLTLTLFPALSLLLPCAGNWIAISSGKRRHN